MMQFRRYQLHKEHYTEFIKHPCSQLAK